MALIVGLETPDQPDVLAFLRQADARLASLYSAYKQQRKSWRMHDSGDYPITYLADLFSVSRPTVYRTLKRLRIARHR